MKDIEQFQEFHRYITLLEIMGYKYDAERSNSEQISITDNTSVKYFNSFDRLKGFVDGYILRGNQMCVDINDIERVVKRDSNGVVKINGKFFPNTVSGVDDKTYENLCKALADGLNCPF